MMDKCALDVSRETFDRITSFVDLLAKWNPKINLVSRGSLEDIWRRHVIDSIETIRVLESPCGTWVDLGSGGGFPGVFVALASDELSQISQLTLIESDSRKAAFLRTAVRNLDIECAVISERIEATVRQNANVISARALAPLPLLLTYCLRHAAEGCQLVLPKGQSWQREIADARDSFKFKLEVVPSVTQEGSVNLVIKELMRA